MSSIAKFLFTLSHDEFYEPIDYFAVNETRYRHRLQELLPDGWTIVRDSIWLHCLHPSSKLLPQGWKVHLSAVAANVDNLLSTVVPLLVQDRTSFKTAAGPTILSLLQSKQWQRGGSGKFMTIYPTGPDHFLSLIEALRQATAGMEGPYILSDRRYKDSKCVFYRYGGIQPLAYMTANGDRVPYLLSPEGEKVPDRREARFNLPPWVKDPFVAETAPVPAAAATLKSGRYLVEAALRHTNSGGLYLARDHETGDKVVIKEARPFTNVDPSGGEAKTLLGKELRLLTKLRDTKVGPRPIDFFQEWEHTFLVEEYLEGITLRQHSILHNVTRFAQPSPTHFGEFYAAFSAIFRQLANILVVLGRNGVVFRDLSPTNVIILKNEEVRLVDFEAATELGVDPMSILFTPGFASSDHFSSDVPQFENDYFSLGALMLAYLMPMHAALGLEPMMHHRFIRAIGDDYGFPESLVQLMTTLTSREPADRPNPTAVIESLASPSPVRPLRIGEPADLSDDRIREVVDRTVDYIVARADFERADRLFPCDPKTLVTNPLNLAYGACGTAYALHEITGRVPTPIMDWILARKVTAEAYSPGLYMGMAGVAWVLLELGHPERAREILAESGRHPVPQTYDLFYGLAGWGLTQLKFYLTLGESEYLEAAAEAGRELLRTRQVTPDGCHWGTPEEMFFGLAHGASGVGLFLLYLYLATGDEQFLRVGRQALDFDLVQSVDLGDGPLWPSRTGPQRTLVPYWRYGSVGVGAVLLRYRQVVSDERYDSALQEIRRSATRRYAIFPQRGFGLTGLGDFLIDMANHGIDEEKSLAAARTVASGVLLFFLDRGDDGIAFPGSELWKISCDLTTGSAGVALFFDRLLTRRPMEFMLDQLLSASAKPTPEWMVAVDGPRPAAVAGELTDVR
jgi:class III lanthionine synthetase